MTALSNTSVAAGTLTNSIRWYNPLNAQIGITRNIIATVIPGTYTAALTHTGSAGSCTSIATLQVFTTSTNYNVFDGTTNGVLRTGFAEANYIGATIPTGAFNITALGYDNVSSATPPVLTPQFIPRNSADFSVTLLQTQNTEIAGLRVYPNPVETLLNVTADCALLLMLTIPSNE